MKLYAWKRLPFKGALYLPIEDPGSLSGTVVMTYDHDVMFDFTDDPNAPRQLIISEEPLPTTSQINNITDRYGVQPLPGAVYTITTVEPIISVFNTRDLFRHQAALSTAPNFGYEIYRA